METGVEKAVRLAGSQTALANRLGISPQAVQKWVDQGYVPADRCRDVETELGGEVTRYELNSKVFGDPPSVASSDSEEQNYGRRKDDPPSSPSPAS